LRNNRQREEAGRAALLDYSSGTVDLDNKGEVEEYAIDLFADVLHFLRKSRLGAAAIARVVRCAQMHVDAERG